MAYESHEFYCVQCGRKGIPIQRCKGQLHKSGHLKKLYCLYCKKEINFCEILENSNTYNYQDFLNEFNGKNFDENGNRILKYGIFKKERCVVNE